MTSDQTNHQTGHPIHFVGSIPLADAETVFRTLAVAVGDRATLPYRGTARTAHGHAPGISSVLG